MTGLARAWTSTGTAVEVGGAAAMAWACSASVGVGVAVVRSPTANGSYFAEHATARPINMDTTTNQMQLAKERLSYIFCPERRYFEEISRHRCYFEQDL